VRKCHDNPTPDGHLVAQAVAIETPLPNYGRQCYCGIVVRGENDVT
jgi:hypothetical protein